LAVVEALVAVGNLDLAVSGVFGRVEGLARASFAVLGLVLLRVAVVGSAERLACDLAPSEGPADVEGLPAVENLAVLVGLTVLDSLKVLIAFNGLPGPDTLLATGVRF